MRIRQDELSLLVLAHRDAVVGRLEAVRAEQLQAVFCDLVDAVGRDGEKPAADTDQGEHVGFLRELAHFAALGGVEAVGRRDVHACRVEVHFPVGRHVVQDRGVQHPLHSAVLQAAEDPVLLLPVLQEDVVRREVGGVEVIEQQLPGRVDLGHLHLVAFDAPLPDEAHGAHLPLRFAEKNDVLPLTAQEAFHRPAVEAHEARERADVDVAAGVLPHRFRLHLRQRVERRVAPVAQVALQDGAVRRRRGDRPPAERREAEQYQSVSCLFTHQLQIYDFLSFPFVT